MKPKDLLKTLASAASLFGFCASVNAQSSDALIDKLVQKGILSSAEAKELREESAKTFATEYRTKAGMPDWVNSLKFNGDFRTRYDGAYQTTDNTVPDRNQFRYRLRFGAVADLTEHFEVGLRLGSGQVNNKLDASGTGVLGSFGGSPFSNNTTFTGDGSKKYIFVDLAYAKWTPCESFQMELGKMVSPFWFTDMTFDPDYNPEGAQEKLRYKLNDDHSFGLSSGQYVILENFSSSGSGNQNDVYLFINQVDWTARWMTNLSTRLAVGMMNFKNQHDISPDLETFINQNGTKATDPVNFNPIISHAEATYLLNRFPFFQGQFPIIFGAEFINNPGSSKDNQGYNLGVTFGSNKKKHNWLISYNYKNIEASSVWHGLNDDDFGFNVKGGTDVRGHQIVGSYHLYNPLTINLRYMITEQINNAPGVPIEQDRIFVDLVWAF